MKQDIHPQYEAAHIVCACGNRLLTRTTKGDLSVEICAVCHPYYTGKQKLIDTAGRVDRFNKKYKQPSAS